MPLLGALLIGVSAAPTPYPPIILRAQQPLTDTGKNLASPYTPAPVPDQDLDSPTRRSEPAHTELTPGLFHPHKTYRGDGFMPGSTIQGEEQRRYKPLPSLNLSVPLE